MNEKWLIIPNGQNVYKILLSAIKMIVEHEHFVFVYYYPDSPERFTEFTVEEWSKGKLTTSESIFGKMR